MLENSLYRLQCDGELRIGYFGGSITEGAGASDGEKTSWRALVTKWFRESYPDAEVSEIRAAIGGTGSDLGAFRLEYDLLQYQPDLVFVEFAVNDFKTEEQSVMCSMEYIVRAILTANPYADIIFIYTATKVMHEWVKNKKRLPSVSIHERLSEHYHIPSINVGETFMKNVDEHKCEWEELTIDNVHPTDKGYAIYAEQIINYLKQHFCTGNREKRVLPKHCFNPFYISAELVDAWECDTNFERINKSMYGRYPHMICADRCGQQLKLEFFGTTIGLYYAIERDTGYIEWSVDGGEFQKENMWDKYAMQFNRANYKILADSLSCGKHTLILRALGAKDECSEGTWIRIGAFLLGKKEKEKMKIYVSPTGNDLNDGSKEMPFQSFSKAKEYIKDLPSDTEVCVIFCNGRYFIDRTIHFDQDDRKNVIYAAQESGQVFFDGGIVIPPERVKKTTDEEILACIIEESAREFIQEIDLSEYSFDIGEYGNRGFRRPYIAAPNELFIDGNAQKTASYPKCGYLPQSLIYDCGSIPREGDFSMRGGCIGYEVERGDKWINAKNAYISGFFGNAYADDTVKLERIDTQQRRMYTAAPTLYGFRPGAEQRWRIVNLLEEIGEKGEYYIDAETKKLYFYPPYDVSKSLIQLSVTDGPMLSFKNASNITFCGITFENSRGSGITIEGGENIQILNCEFRNLGMLAVQIGKGAMPLPDGLHDGHGKCCEGIRYEEISGQPGSWHEYIYKYPAFDGDGGKNHLISGCRIYNMGAGGILLGGGNRKKLIPANNMVYNCHIYQVNRLDLTYKGAVNVWGVGNIIRNCELEDLDGFAVYIHGNDHLLEYTKIHNAAKIISDGAAIYMGRDPSEVGNKIRHNFIYDIKNPHSYDMYGFAAIYFDDYAIYNEVYGNYFYDIVQRGPFLFSTVHWNGGGMTTVANNIFIDCYPGVNPNMGNNAYDKMHNDEVFAARVHTCDERDLSGVDVTSDIWRKKYPYLYETYVNDYIRHTLYYNNFICSGQYQNFTDENPSHLNFKLRKDSYLFEQKVRNLTDCVRRIENRTTYFEDIDFYRIGLLR